MTDDLILLQRSRRMRGGKHVSELWKGKIIPNPTMPLCLTFSAAGPFGSIEVSERGKGRHMADVGQDIKMKTLEAFAGLGFLAILVLLSAFIILFIITPASRPWILFLPLLLTVLYIPYESYYSIPEVSLGVPIRVDLLAIVPLFEFMFIAATIGWIISARKYNHKIGYPMSLVMGILTIAWPIYVATYLMGFGL